MLSSAGVLYVGRPEWAGALEVSIPFRIAFSFGTSSRIWRLDAAVWRLSLSEETDADATAKTFNLIRCWLR